MMTAAVRDSGSDENLARAARSGEEPALAQLYLRHARLVHSVAYRITLHHQDAEDVVQDVFMALTEALNQYDENRPFIPWLRRIAARVALARLRSDTRRVHRENRSAHLHLHEEAVSEIEIVALKEALWKLPLHLRVVLLLKEVEGYSHEEIGRMLNIAPKTSAMRLHRAWKALRKETG